MIRSDDFVIDDAFDDSSCDEDDVASKLVITHPDSCVRNTNTSSVIRRKQRRVSFSVPLTAISIQPIVQCKSVMKSPGDVASTQQYLPRPSCSSQQQQSPSKVLYSGIIPMDRNQDENTTPSYSDRVADDEVVTSGVADDNDDDACLLLSIVNSFDNSSYIEDTVTSSTTTPSSTTTMDRYHHVDMTMDNTTTLRHQHQYNKPWECYIFVDHDTDTDDDHSYNDIKSTCQSDEVLNVREYDNAFDFSNDNDENNNTFLTSSLQYSTITMKSMDFITSTNRKDSANLTTNENLQPQHTATGNSISPTKQVMKTITSGINKLKTKFVKLNEKKDDQHHIQHHHSPTLIQKKNHRISDLAVQALSDNYGSSRSEYKYCGHGGQNNCTDVNQSSVHHSQSQQVQQEKISSLTRDESNVVFKIDMVQNKSFESPMKQLISYDDTSTTMDDVVDTTKIISLSTSSSNDTTETSTTSTNSTDSSSCCSSNQSEHLLDDITTTTTTTTTNDINIGTTDCKNGVCIQSISLLIHDFLCETPKKLCHEVTPTLMFLKNIHHETNKRAIQGIHIVPWLVQYHNICLFEDDSMILHSFYHVCCQLLSTFPKKHFS